MTHPHNDPPPLHDQLCYAIYTAGIAIQRAYKPLLDELGLTYPQYLVLNVLWSEDGQTVGAIANALALESSTLTPLLKRLETSGLLRRTRNLSNERQVVDRVDRRRTCLAAQGRLSQRHLACSFDPDAAGIGRPEPRRSPSSQRDLFPDRRVGHTRLIQNGDVDIRPSAQCRRR